LSIVLELKKSARHVSEIAWGLLGANMGDALNIFFMSMFSTLLLDKPYLLALIPSLAALRGSIATSMASRVTTGLYLGQLGPRVKDILYRESARTTVLGLSSSIYAGIIVGLVAGYPVFTTVSAAGFSALLALLILLPATSLLAVVGFGFGLNPDNYMAPILTVLGDITTVPALVMVSYFIGVNRGVDTFLTLLLIYATLTLMIALAYTNRNHRRVIVEGLLALLLVGLIESVTGGFFAGYSALLATIGVLHMVPSLMEDIGASISIYASRASTILHIEGFEESLKKTPRIIVETYLGSIPAMITLSTIGYLALGIAGLQATYLFILRATFLLWTTMLFALSLIVLVLIWSSQRIGLDPDNIVIPLITSLVDMTTIPWLVFIYLEILA